MADNFVKIRKTMKESYEEKQRKLDEKNSICPALILDYERQAVTFNDKLWDLNPDSAEIKSDLENLVKYVNVTEIFIGDISSLLRGQKNGGKSSIVVTGQRLMFDRTLPIFEEYKNEVPKELKVFHWKDYLGEEVKYEKSIKGLFEYAPNIFKIDKKRDTLIIDLSAIDQKTLAQILKVLEGRVTAFD